MSIPPHLPPPVSSIARHRQWYRLKMIGAAAFFGLCAGITGASILLGWIWPGFDGDYSYLSSHTSASFSRQSLEEQMKIKIAEKVFNIYQKSTIQSGSRLLDPADHLIDGVVGISSGWLVAYLPAYDGRFRDWVILGPNGSLYRATKVLADKKSGLIYIKMARLVSGATPALAEQFKAAVFTDEAEKFDDVYILQDSEWHTAVLGREVGATSGASHTDSAPARYFTLSTSFRAGSLAIDNQGNVIGFVVTGAKIMPIAPLAGVFEGIEDRARVPYPTLGLEGWYAEDRLIFVGNVSAGGFFVNTVVAGKSGLRRGDIVLEINGRPMNYRNLWYNIRDKSVRLKVLRAGKEIEVEVTPFEI